MASPSDWGPPLWRVLHSLAERLGKHTVVLLAQDERRAWMNFLRSIEYAMPCAKCRAHYKAYRTAHSIDRALSVQGEALRNWARQWLWSLHEEVNRDAGKTGPTLEEIPGLYGIRTPREISADINEVYAQFNKGITLRLTSVEAVHTFKTHLSMVRRLLP